MCFKNVGGVPDLGREREVHVHVLQFGCALEVDTVNSLIIMYVKCEDVCSARIVFDRMVNRDRISWRGLDCLL